ncbi:hypothetical protein [uncultured Bacteroides sp.]|uniref:hypothetical protein n=2 Tax=uncultured Bacteroides sp. TaxID=162156 RepID=UPI002607B99B|nr:hypothetical protein [uncultured Bacteroides sp.]
MKANMKKKFDFSAEMSEVESIKATPKNEYLEEENRLLDINAKELASLNDNVYKLRTEVENLSDSIRECKPIISEEMHKLAVEFGARLLCDFLSQIESKCKEAERRIKKVDNTIPIPDTAFYILIIIVVALSSFFVCMIGANAEILHSVLIWKAVICCIIMAVLGIGIAVVIQKFSDRGK